MKEKLINMLKGTKNGAHFIRAIVGGYVVFTCGKVAVSYFTTDDVSVGLMIASAFVALLGLAIVSIAFWAIAKGYSVEYQGKSPFTMPDEETDGEEADETAQLTEESEDSSEIRQ